MNTLEFIELLKEADPKGEATIVIGSYPVIGCDVAPGYWDGHFWKPLDKEGKECSKEEYPAKLSLTGSGLKLKIHYMDPDSLLWDHMTAKGFNIEDYIQFDSSYANKSDREEQRNSWLKELNETYNYAHDFRVKRDEEWVPKTKDLFKNDNYVIQERSGTDKFWMTYHITDDKKEVLMQGYIMCLNNYPEFFEFKENAEKTERIWSLKE